MLFPWTLNKLQNKDFTKAPVIEFNKIKNKSHFKKWDSIFTTFNRKQNIHSKMKGEVAKIHVQDS